MLANSRDALLAARFLKPPGRCKRAELREKPRRKVGPFENPVRRFVRLREKARQFCELPPPRKIPIPKPLPTPKLLQIPPKPSVSPQALQKRLEFFLNSETPKLQQMSSKLRVGITPYQAEKFMWLRQLTDIRKCYRAQYFQKLAEVTADQQLKQKLALANERQERKRRRREILERRYDATKRKAILKDRMRIERKVTQSAEFARSSRRKTYQINHFHRIQQRANLLKNETLSEAAILTRNVSMPDILQKLGHSDDGQHIKTKQSVPADNVFRSLMEESFKILPEDAMQYEEVERDVGISETQRAEMEYSGFSESEKLELLDEKIQILSEQIDQQSQGAPKDLLAIQLKEQLEAVRAAHLERKEEKEVF